MRLAAGWRDFRFCRLPSDKQADILQSDRSGSSQYSTNAGNGVSENSRSFSGRVHHPEENGMARS
ncbi:hypothetical protein BO223_09205 [Faecalibaculum rodentium]|uniref:Uncharacterized protein n=1 Tax=Faecalibaculum rodentium TaxID=1702221 RepID=A0A1Q9YIQ2_9FIRM|nr:hypothetical protein BO223_09205 [Faecalibaculum rodentium]